MNPPEALPKKPNLRRLAVVGVLFIILSTMLLFWARDVVRELVVLPLSYLIWVIGILVDLVPQFYFWLVVLVIAFMIAYPGLTRKKRMPVAPSTVAYLELQEDLTTSGRTLFWLNKVNLMRSGLGNYHSHVFHTALARLLVDMLAYRYRLTTRLVEEGLRNGSLNLPDDIRDYALEGLDPLDLPQGGFFAWIWSQFQSALRGWFYHLQDAFWKRMDTAGFQAQSASPSSAFHLRGSLDDPRVRRIVQYMEEELEVLHDDTGR